MRKVRHVPHPDLDELAVLAAYLDGKLTGDELAEVISHLLVCESCRAVIKEANESKKNIIPNDPGDRIKH